MTRSSTKSGLSRALVAGSALMLVFAGCAATPASSTGGAADGTLRLAFGAPMSNPDPAFFYENEGLNVIGAAYEGLLQFAPNTPENPTTATASYEPLLAESYEVTPDGLNYTFKLRQGVKFHDGTPMDSLAVKASFERFKDVGGGPSYMLEQVASYETPDKTTFVVNLATPVNPFLEFIASPYGPKVMSPAAIAANSKDGDLAQEWLKTHDAGTGPYAISEFGSSAYTLTAFPEYWGSAPAYERVQISIVPSFATQQLQLEQGSLDLLVNGVLPRDRAQLESKGLKTWTFDNPVLDVIHVNTDKGPFARPEFRQALAKAIDREALVKAAFPDAGSLAVTTAPKAGLPAGTETFKPGLDTSELKNLVATLPASERKISIVYATQDTVNQQIANLVQGQLAALGFDATAAGQPLEQIFSWPSSPDLRSDLLILQSNGDGANPFTWYSLFYANGGGLSFMNSAACGDADALVKRGFGTADPEAAAATYVEADKAYVACGAFIPIADTKGIMAYRPGLTELVHPFASQTAVLLGKVRPVNP